MKNFARLFILKQELGNPEPGTTLSAAEEKLLEIDRLITLHEVPSMINDAWLIPTWSGMAADRGFIDTSAYY